MIWLGNNRFGKPFGLCNSVSLIFFFFPRDGCKEGTIWFKVNAGKEMKYCVAYIHIKPKGISIGLQHLTRSSLNFLRVCTNCQIFRDSYIKLNILAISCVWEGNYILVNRLPKHLNTSQDTDAYRSIWHRVEILP